MKGSGLPYDESIKRTPPIPGGARFSLSDRQRKIWEGLVKKDKRLGDIYLGSLQVLSDKSNPARFTLAAHGFRALGWLYRGSPPISTREPQKTGSGGSHKTLIKQKIVEDDPLGGAPAPLLEDITKRWVDDLHGWFNNLSKGFDVEVSQREFGRKLEELEDILSSLLTPHFDVIAAIDALLAVTKPGKSELLHLKTLLSKGWAVYAYFFEKAGDNWLVPLAGAGFFSVPLSQQRWPESAYLARMASSKPKEVMQIICRCPATDNHSVHADFVSAAIGMPPAVASRIIPLMEKQKWLKSTYHTFLPHVVADLMAKLAGEGALHAALRVAYLLTDVTTNGSTGFLTEAIPVHSDKWQYKQTVEEKMEGLYERAPIELFSLFCTRLAKALLLESRGRKNKGDPDDYSYIWRPNLGHARTHYREDAKNTLIDAIVKTIQLVAKKKPEKLRSLSRVLKTHKYRLFRRIELHMYRDHPSPFTKDIQRLLTDETLIESFDLRREYLPLLTDHFSNLDSVAQRKILKVVESGFGMKRMDKEPQDQFEAATAGRQLMYLKPIADKLPMEWKTRYESLLSKHGEPHDDDGEIKSWVGPTSPVTKEELNKKTLGEILEYLIAWEPPKDRFGVPSPEGLGRLFQEVVAQRASEFAGAAGQLFEKKVRPVYIYHLFYGLKEALKKEECFDWLPVLDLCTAVVKTFDQSEFPKAADDFEPDWRSIRKVMVDIIGDGLTSRHCPIPFSTREKVWEVLSFVSNDEDPTPEHEQKYGGDNMDSATLSINTVRGEAIHAVMKYAFWCAHSLYPNKEEAKKVDSKLVPEVREVLDKHLDFSADPSVAVRAVYGWYLPNLFYLDRKWIAENLGRIFPDSDEQRELRTAAWETYLSNDVYRDLFEILVEEYRRSIELLQVGPSKRHRYADLNERLPQHFMIAYAYDFAHNDLIKEFFGKAPPGARGEAISFVGRAILRKELAQIPLGETDLKLEKLRVLWEERLNLPKEEQHKDELKEFGWWFTRSPFDRSWTIRTLVRTLQATEGDIEAEHEIVPELKNYMDEFPVDAVSVLSLIARGDKEGWRIHSPEKDYREVIERTMKSGNKKARETATDLIHYLGRRGFREYRDLLNS